MDRLRQHASHDDEGDGGDEESNHDGEAGVLSMWSRTLQHAAPRRVPTPGIVVPSRGMLREVKTEVTSIMA